MGREDYQLGVSKMFLKAGKGRFLEDLKEKPVDEILPVLKAKLVEWDRKKRALPMVSKFLHMQVKRQAYLRKRRLTIMVQTRRRGVLARRDYAVKLAAYKKAKAEAKAGQRRGGSSSVEAAAVARAEEAAIEYAEVQAEVANEMGLHDKAAESAATAVRLGGAPKSARGGGSSSNPWALNNSEEGPEAVTLPELLDPTQLQGILQGQDYHMMETEVRSRCPLTHPCTPSSRRLTPPVVILLPD